MNQDEMPISVDVAAPEAMDDAELQAFLAAGYNQQQALEVVLGISLATLCNFANSLVTSNQQVNIVLRCNGCVDLRHFFGQLSAKLSSGALWLGA